MAGALHDAGHTYSEGAVAEAVRAFNAEHRAMHLEGRDLSQPERLERVLELIEPGLAARFSLEAFRAFEVAVSGSRRADPPVPAADAARVLAGARGRGLGLGLISVTGLTPGYVLREVLAGHGLLSYFDALTFSDEARMAKPAPAIFHCTLEVLGVRPEEAAYIGDTPFADVDGPRAAGMWAVQLGDREKYGMEPHARIDTLSDLLPALENLGLLPRSS
jgi:putative hydrolase of the HAD superfamily